MKQQNEIISELKSFWGVHEFIFEAQYAINKKGNGFFRNLRKVTDGSRIFLPNGNQLTVGVPKDLKFEEGMSYVISVFVPNDEIRTRYENDYTIFLDTKKSPPKTLESTPESYVKSLEREYKSVIGIGLDSLKGAIKRISYDINRKPETFIFELLQNADDYYDKQKGNVAVSFKIIDNHLVFQHNGSPFNSNNVRALCSVDAGDKEYDFEKIGYKGIGFKSIFKHSNYVMIHSGGYTFKFDENYHRIQGKDTFWQLIPIWTDLSELPETVAKQISNNFSVTVIIKPEEGNSQLISYEETFNTIFKDERVLLFLRRVEHFSFAGTSTRIEKWKDSDAWAISKLNSVLVPDELKKTINAKIKVDDRIPQKYEDVEKTVLTFATIKREGKVFPTDQAHIYAYLPTDLDFGFPFLLNGDFIPDGGRHYLHADLEWNQFLFREAGKNLLKWIAELWLENNDFGAYEMLPDEKKLVSERPGDEKDILLKCFLNGLSEEKTSTRFIAIESNELCCVSEIILDDTGLFSKEILPNSLYYNISNSIKKLPHPRINQERLYTSYLGLEKFTPKQFIDLLFKDENKSKLKEVINSIESSKYLEFMSWFNTFCYVNSVPNNWLLSIPIVLVNDDTFSISEVLSFRNFIFRNQRTKNIEEILTKIGFELSSIYIDDQNYQYLYGILLQQEIFLKSDLKLYEHLAAAKDFSKLTASEKNTLIAFFQSLVEVGPSKYAKTLPLFKAQKKEGSLKPLNSLISNTCTGLPTWLNDFVIDAEEEKALAQSFQAQLLKEQDLFEKFFCNKEIFEEIVLSIDEENIESFYTYVLRLHNSREKNTPIDKSIPWLYISKTGKFVTDSEVYLPDSFLKITPSQYASVKKVFEAISEECLPHFAALQLKEPFALGGKPVDIKCITPITEEFETNEVNDFLDWAEIHGETELLNYFSFSKNNDKFAFCHKLKGREYYTDKKELIELIENSSVKDQLFLLPRELHANNRFKIGLLEGSTLLEFIIENDYAVPALAKFVQERKDLNLGKRYLAALKELHIDSEKSYTPDDSEFIVLKMVIQYLGTEKDELKIFRSKIYFDGNSLLERAVSEDIFFYDKNKGLKIKLSEILPIYKDKSFPLSDIIKNFIDFDDYKGLVAVFKEEGRSPKKILKELFELKSAAYNAAQTFFISYYQWLYPDEAVLQDKVFISETPYFENDRYVSELHQFLDHCLHEGAYTDFVQQQIIQDFKPYLLISDTAYALEKEQLPAWFVKWLKDKKGEDVEAFIKKLGINGADSSVVQLRKGLLGDSEVNMDAARGGIKESELLINTFWWLTHQTQIQPFNRDTLKPLYNLAKELGISIKQLPIPELASLSPATFSLLSYEINKKYHCLNTGWVEFKHEIFLYLKEMKEAVIDGTLLDYFTDEINPIMSKCNVITLLAELEKNSTNYNADFYNDWANKDSFKIKAYPSDYLPQNLVYNGEIIKELNVCEYFKDKDNEIHYVAQTLLLGIPDSIKKYISEAEFKELDYARLNHANKTQKEISSELTPEQEEAIKRFFNGIVPENQRKNQNLVALASAIIYLSAEGYDMSKAGMNLDKTHGYAQLEPVYENGNYEKAITIMCRSARKGLLYLTQNAWNRLENPTKPNVYLFVYTGKDRFHLFKRKQDILNVNDRPTDFQMMRIETEANAENIDSILSGNFNDASKIWIIFRIGENKEFDLIYYKDYQNDLESIRDEDISNHHDSGIGL